MPERSFAHALVGSACSSSAPCSSGGRRLRYIGTIKNNAWLHTRAAAVNLRALINLGLVRTDGTWTLAITPV
ncbi:hypothetical protein ACIBF6_04315 [Streptosporangium amethystogenes]|uniref:hypothetical protein n=1 Tax=Streptosporangium amethystogenes TaxID=2002 RepID=UPI00378F9B52